MTLIVRRLTLSKFLPFEAGYIAQFNDNPHCVRAVQMAITHLDREDEVNINILRRLAYVASVSAQSVDDDVFICAMLHPLAEYKHNELPVLMTGLGFEALKVVEALRETRKVSELYHRISTLDAKYKAIVVARVMYRLINIELYEYEAAESIIEEAKEYTSKLDAPLDIMIQLGNLLNHAQRVFNEIFIEEVLEEEEEEDEITKEELTDAEYEIEIMGHKRLADEIGVINKQEIYLEGIGKVTYYDGVGFCDDNGEVVTLNSDSSGDTAGVPKKVSMLEDKFDYEVKLHKKVAESLGVSLDRQVIQLGIFGKVVYSQGIGFFNENAEMIELSGSVFDYIDSKYTQGKSTVKDIIDTDFDEADIDLSAAESAIESAKHHRLATTLQIKDQSTINIQNIGKVTYSETLGFIDELGQLINLDEALLK